MTEQSELLSLLGSVGSTLAIVAGIVWQAFLLIPIGAILLTAFVGFFFQRQIQKETRKYEIRKLSVQEALGPIYGEMLKIVESIRSAPSDVSLNMHSDIPGHWSEIRYSHKFFVVQEPLRTQIDEFFKGYADFQTNIANLRPVLDSLEKKGWAAARPERCDSGTNYILKDGNREHRSIQDAIFWRTNPSHSTGLPWYRLYGQFTNLETLIQSSLSFEKNQAKEQAEAIFEVAWPEADNDPTIAKVKISYNSIRRNAEDLLSALEKEITDWAGKGTT